MNEQIEHIRTLQSNHQFHRLINIIERQWCQQTRDGCFGCHYLFIFLFYFSKEISDSSLPLSCAWDVVRVLIHRIDVSSRVCSTRLISNSIYLIRLENAYGRRTESECLVELWSQVGSLICQRILWNSIGDLRFSSGFFLVHFFLLPWNWNKLMFLIYLFLFTRKYVFWYYNNLMRFDPTHAGLLRITRKYRVPLPMPYEKQLLCKQREQRFKSTASI